jgi:hypothetical protein
MTFASPAKLKIDTSPPAPSGTRIDPDVTVPGFGLMTDVFGCALPAGHTVMNDGAVTSKSTVTFSNTEMASAGTGTPGRLGAAVVSGTLMVAPGPSGAGALTATPGARVSSTRLGVTPTKPSASPGDCDEAGIDPGIKAIASKAAPATNTLLSERTTKAWHTLWTTPRNVPGRPRGESKSVAAVGLDHPEDVALRVLHVREPTDARNRVDLVELRPRGLAHSGNGILQRPPSPVLTSQ